MIKFKVFTHILKNNLSKRSQASCWVYLNNRNYFNFSSENIQENQGLNQKQKEQLLKFQNLLHQNTDESLTQAAYMLGKLENVNQQQQSQLQQLNQRISFFPANLLGLLQKEKKLIENISLQQQDDLLIGKRIQKQLEDCKKYGVSKIAKQVLQVSDALRHSLKLAKQIYDDHNDHQQVKKLEQARNKMIKILNFYGIQEFDPINQPYDPNTQQSVYEVPCPQGFVQNTVAETMRTGFKIKGRLLRSARVGIFTQKQT